MCNGNKYHLFYIDTLNIWSWIVVFCYNYCTHCTWHQPLDTICSLILHHYQLSSLDTQKLPILYKFFNYITTLCRHKLHTLSNSLHICINTTLNTLTTNLNFTSTYSTPVSNHTVSCRLALSPTFFSKFFVMSLITNISFINLWSASSSYTTTLTNHLVSDINKHTCVYTIY